MPRVMEKVIPVKITADEINCYATISRSCISAITACTRLGMFEKVQEFKKLKHWADGKYDTKVDQHLSEKLESPVK